MHPCLQLLVVSVYVVLFLIRFDGVRKGHCVTLLDGGFMFIALDFFAYCLFDTFVCIVRFATSLCRRGTAAEQWSCRSTGT